MVKLSASRYIGVPMDQRIKTGAAALLLMAVVLLAYGPAYRAGFIWDDDDYVHLNETLREPGGLKRIWMEPGATPQYYPATFTSFWLEYRIWGAAPAGYHAVNVLLHAANAALLWRLLLVLGVPGAWCIALVFGLHPVHVESVAWITERKNTLSGFFYLLAALSYLRFRPPVISSGPAGFRHYGVALAFFVLALLSKTTACSLPAALLLLAWWKRGRLAWCDVAPMLPLFAIGASLAAMTVYMESTHVRASGAEWELGAFTRLLIAVRGLWFYACKLAWPADLVFIYPRLVPDPSRALDWIPVLAALLLGAVLWIWRRQLGRGVFTALFFYAGTLFPALGFINIYPMRYSFVADHYVYLASIGLLSLAGAGLAALLRRAATPARVTLPALALLSSLLGLATWRQTLMYRDLETLWTTTIAHNPSAWMAHNNLGLLRHQAGRLEEAERLYRDAYALNPSAPEVLTNLGNIEAERKAWEAAEQWHRQALAVRQDFAPGWYNLGNVMMEQGRLREAADSYRRALAIKPRYPEALANLAKTQAQQGQFTYALDLYRRSLAIDPMDVSTWGNLAFVYLRMGQPSEAVRAASRALDLDPRHVPALHHRALAQQALGRLTDAGRDFKAAMDASTPGVALLNDYGVFLLQTADFAAAEDHFRQALQWAPDELPLRYGLGASLAGRRKKAEALEVFRHVLAVHSNHIAALNSAAWLLATDDTSTLAEGEVARLWAQRAVELSDRREPSTWSTLAAAHARCGDYANAIRALDEATALVAARGDEGRVDVMKRRRQRLEQRLPILE